MDAQSYLFEAKAALRDNRRDMAWRLLHKHISAAPEDVEAWLMLGGLAASDSSLAYLRQAEKIAPEDPKVKRAIQWAENRAAQAATKSKEAKDLLDEMPPGSTEPVQVEISPSTQPLSQTQADPEDQKKPLSKTATWLKYAGLAVFAGVVAFLVIIGVSALITGTEPQIFGHRIMIVTSGSMEPTFYTGSIILVDVENDQPPVVGDVVMFSTAEDPEKNITHRILEVRLEDGRRVYLTKGDNNDAPDQTIITDENIIGKYVGLTVPYLGYFFSFIKSRKGILLLAILFGLYLVITQVFRIKTLLAEEDV